MWIKIQTFFNFNFKILKNKYLFSKIDNEVSKSQLQLLADYLFNQETLKYFEPQVI